MRHELPYLLERGGGTIVNVTSTGGLISTPGWGDYVTAKSAVPALTRTAAMEYAARGVRINALAPGATRTEMFEEVGPEHRSRWEEQMADWIPMAGVALRD